MTGASSIDDAETLRLAALDRYAILDTASEPGFDDIVDLAIQICGVPISLVSLIDKDRQWFKSRVGFAPCQTALSQSICVHALAADDLLMIPDLTQDPRTRDNTLVTGPDRLRFYAGAVLKTPLGVPFGSLCVIDVEPRPGALTDRQQAALKTLARQVVTQLELRRALAERDHALDERRRAETLLHRDIDRHEAMIALQAKIGEAAGRSISDPGCGRRGCVACHSRSPGVRRGADPGGRARHRRSGRHIGPTDRAKSADARQSLGREPPRGPDAA